MKRLALVASVCAFASMAHADWQYTHWGQSTEDVLAIAEKGIRKATPQETKDWSYEAYGKALAVGAYSTSEFKFPAYFIFRDNKLSGVALSIATKEQALAVKARLNDQYGSPKKADKSYDQLTACTTESSAWEDKDEGNVISIRYWYCDSSNSQYYTLMYRPILKSKDTGL